MSRVIVHMEVDAAPEDVWKVVSDPRNLPKWDRHVTKVEGVPEDGLRVGTVYNTEITFWGVRANVKAEVVEIEAPKMSRVKLSGLLDAVVTTRIVPLQGGSRSRLVHEVEYGFRGGPIGAIAAQALQLSGGPRHVVRRGIAGQKRQIESA